MTPLIVGEELVLLPVPYDRIAWREDLDPKIVIVRQLNGVHPSSEGHALFAQAWLKAVQA